MKYEIICVAPIHLIYIINKYLRLGNIHFFYEKCKAWILTMLKKTVWSLSSSEGLSFCYPDVSID